MPEVCVVIPAYNAARTLPETLASLLAQTFEDFEAVVVDDGSTDETASLADGTGDPRVRVLTVANGGVSRARNHGIAAGTAPFVAFLDADDLWRPQKLERQLEGMRREPDAGFCVTAAQRIDAESHEVGGMPIVHPRDVCEALLLHSMIVGCLSSGLVRREILDRAGHFDPRFSQSADWDLWLRLATITRPLILDDQLVLYRTSAGNMSSDITLLERDTFAVLDAFFAAPHSSGYGELRSRAYSTHWLVCAGSYLHTGNLRAAVRCLWRALLTRPASITRVLGTPVRWLQRARGAARDLT